MINGTTSSGSGHSVPDYKDALCHDRQRLGTPIYKLEAVDMDCYPVTLARWTVIVLSCIGSGFITPSVSGGCNSFGIVCLCVCLCVCVCVRPSHYPGQTNTHTGLNFGMQVKVEDI